MISYSPVSSVSRSPIRNSIGRTRVVPGGSGGGIPGNGGWSGLAFGRFFAGRGLATHVSIHQRFPWCARCVAFHGVGPHSDLIVPESAIALASKLGCV